MNDAEAGSATQEGQQPKSKQNGGGGFLDMLESPIKALTLAAGVFAVFMYGVLVLAYAQFYGPFGVSIDEVGRSRLDVLPEALAGPFKAVLTARWAYLMLLVSVIIAVLLHIFFGARSGDTSIGRRLSSTRISRHLPAQVWMIVTRNRRTVVACLIVSLLGGVAQVSYSETTIARKYGTQARDTGFAVSGIYLEGGVMKTPLLEILALPATAHWKGDNPAPLALQANPDCLLYLGQNDGRVVLYNVKARSVLHVALSDIILVVRPDTLRENPRQEKRGWPCSPDD